jgi:hypothetical protein
MSTRPNIVQTRPKSVTETVHDDKGNKLLDAYTRASGLAFNKRYYLPSTFNSTRMGRLAEMQRKLLEVCVSP